MAFDAGSVVAHIRADVSDFENGMNRARGQVNGLSGSVGKAGTIMKGALVAGTVAAAAGVALLGKSSVEAAADFEQTKISFEVMLGSAGKATKLLAELQAFAKKTPFNLSELQESTKRLLAYGVEGDKVIDTMNTLGNITSAVGRDKMPQLILAFGQAKAAGRLFGTELRQFNETGVPMTELLAKHLGVAKTEIASMASDGKISFEQLQGALESLGGEGGKWGDMMDRQSQTLSGSLSNLQDNWQQLLVTLGTVFIPVATQVVQAINGILTPLMGVLKGSEDWKTALANMGVDTKMFEEILQEFLSFLNETLLPAVAAVTAALSAWWKLHGAEVIASLTVLWGFIQIVWALIYGFLKIGLEVLAGDWSGAWKAMVQMAMGAWAGLQTMFGGMLSYIANWGGNMFDILTKPFKDAWNTISDLVNKIKDKLDFTKRHSPSVLDVVNRGVDLVNKAYQQLDYPLSEQAMGGAMGGAPVSGAMNVNIDLSGALISDEAGAMRVGEIVGDSIIRKLQANIRV